MRKCYLTTYDNPYDPSDIDQFILWDLYDKEKGYNSSAYLARIARTSESLTDKEYNDEIERAIDEIIKIDPFNLYKKIVVNA